MKTKKTLTLRCYFLIGCLVLSGCAHVDGESTGDVHSSGFVVNSLFGFYGGPLNHLSAVRSGSCPMDPSCSVYARDAMEQHGFFVGWVMAMDRLMRCGRDETELAPAIWKSGRWKTFDPVSANDFWWNRRAPASFDNKDGQHPAGAN